MVKDKFGRVSKIDTKMVSKMGLSLGGDFATLKSLQKPASLREREESSSTDEDVKERRREAIAPLKKLWKERQ